jgi:hypothetical protein
MDTEASNYYLLEGCRKRLVMPYDFLKSFAKWLSARRVVRLQPFVVGIADGDIDFHQTFFVVLMGLAEQSLSPLPLRSSLLLQSFLSSHGA